MCDGCFFFFFVKCEFKHCNTCISNISVVYKICWQWYMYCVFTVPHGAYHLINFLSRYADELQRWRMCLGKHNLTYTEPSERCINISGIYRHEGFKYPTVPMVEFDIALLRLQEEVTPSDEISYACLPSEEEVLPEGKKCYATGWGDETGVISASRFNVCIFMLI